MMVENHLEPFFWNKDCVGGSPPPPPPPNPPSSRKQKISGLEVCFLASKSANNQLLNGIWLLYTKNKHSLAQLLIKGNIVINSQSIKLHNKNPVSIVVPKTV